MKVNHNNKSIFITAQVLFQMYHYRCNVVCDLWGHLRRPPIPLLTAISYLTLEYGNQQLLEWPITVDHDSIEASLSRLKRCLDVSASLQRRRWPDEAIWDGRQLHCWRPYHISRCEYGNQQLLEWPITVGHDSIEASFSRHTLTYEHERLHANALALFVSATYFVLQWLECGESQQERLVFYLTRL